MNHKLSVSLHGRTFLMMQLSSLRTARIELHDCQHRLSAGNTEIWQLCESYYDCIVCSPGHAVVNALGELLEAVHRQPRPLARACLAKCRRKRLCGQQVGAGLPAAEQGGFQVKQLLNSNTVTRAGLSSVVWSLPAVDRRCKVRNLSKATWPAPAAAQGQNVAQCCLLNVAFQAASCQAAS